MDMLDLASCSQILPTNADKVTRQPGSQEAGRQDRFSRIWRRAGYSPSQIIIFLLVAPCPLQWIMVKPLWGSEHTSIGCTNVHTSQRFYLLSTLHHARNIVPCSTECYLPVHLFQYGDKWWILLFVKNPQLTWIWSMTTIITGLDINKLLICLNGHVQIWMHENFQVQVHCKID